MVFQPVSGVVDFNLDGVMFPGFFEGYTKWNMVDPAPHLKFKKLLRDIRFFFKWSQPKQAIGIFVLQVGGSVVQWLSLSQETTFII